MTLKIVVKTHFNHAKNEKLLCEKKKKKTKSYRERPNRMRGPKEKLESGDD